MNDAIQLKRSGPVAVLTLNRPKSVNSLSLDAIKALLAQLRGVANDNSVRALVITGAGRAFCAGWQLDDQGMPGLPDESFGVRQSHHPMEEYFNPVIQALHDLSIPSLAAVNGVCADAGVNITLAADVVIASDMASFLPTFAP